MDGVPTVIPGELVPASALVDVTKLVSAYFTQQPDPEDERQRVTFGTSGHRGSSLKGSFNETHIAAIVQAVCDYRKAKGISGPLFLGRDTHALSYPAYVTSIEVLVANGVEVLVDSEGGYTPTPVVSHAILRHNRRERRLADGIVVTPSHNPPEDGGIKYNESHGGPADTAATRWIEQRANQLLRAPGGVRRVSWTRATKADTVHTFDYLSSYVDTLPEVIEIDAIARAGLRIGVDPLGGAAVTYWSRIAERYKLELEVVNEEVDPTFRFMPADWDGRIRMDCSSPYAMRKLIDLRDRFDIAFGNDADADRHGIVTRAGGLLNPNHYLSVAVSYLFPHRAQWPTAGRLGKTVVTTQMIDRITAALGRELFEVPVGFKWFVSGLFEGSVLFAGEESAGATLLARDGKAWTTDKDGIVLNLLAAEIHSTLQADLADVYRKLEQRFGSPAYQRIDAPATPDQKKKLASLRAADVQLRELAGSRVIAVLDKAPGNGASIGGIKVVAEDAWFAARPSGTEDVYKLYAESFRGAEHLREVQEVARQFLATIL
ncbi:MAG: phosphoglucomutase (alpha-D-glucose-1,6-bisphosphate-dependent) [Candidatus Binatia bacterium]|nr:phosphoglucomutase (alpha-D-glucose-1,6-bisphosphate-dependent) [Candidatus Binatia bacterium]